MLDTRLRTVVLVLAVSVVAAGCVQADEEEGMGKTLQVGDPVPSFSLPGSDGKTYATADLLGRTVVVAWFPKAFTGG